jgi:hypothetical protein
MSEEAAIITATLDRMADQLGDRTPRVRRGEGLHAVVIERGSTTMN